MKQIWHSTEWCLSFSRYHCPSKKGRKTPVCGNATCCLVDGASSILQLLFLKQKQKYLSSSNFHEVYIQAVSNEPSNTKPWAHTILALAFYHGKAQKEVLELLYPTLRYVLPGDPRSSRGVRDLVPAHTQKRDCDFLYFLYFGGNTAIPGVEGGSATCLDVRWPTAAELHRNLPVPVIL